MKIFLIVIMSVALEFIISPFRLLGLGYSTILGFSCYFLFFILIYRRFHDRYQIGFLLFLAISGILIIYVPLQIRSFGSTLSTLPDAIFHIFGGISGFFYIKFYGKIRIALLSTSILVTVWMSVFGHDLWQREIDFGSFDSKKGNDSAIQVMGYKIDGKLLTNNDLKSDYVLLDFWFIGCKPCFDEFPRLQSVYENPKYKGKVTIFAMNLPMSTDTIGQAFEILNSKGYSFTNLIQKKTNDVNSLNIKVCPTTVILDKNRKVVFKGDLKKAKEFLDLKVN